MADLIVELYGTRVGRLVGRHWRTFDFVADRDAFTRFQLGSTVMSESTPLEAAPSRRRAARRRNFFAELLPEGDMLEALAAQAEKGTSSQDTIALLARFGRDVAGALQIFDPELPGEPRTPQAAPISREDVGYLLQNVLHTPLGNRRVFGKSSLSGVQDKIVLARIGDQWNQVLDGYPSTHIIKPVPRENATGIFDEEYGARVAKAAGLAPFDTRLEEFGAVTGLVIERYDRDPDAPDGRLHQEDLGQALGIPREAKYQEHGGQAILVRAAQMFSSRGDTASLVRLLKMTTVSVAVGNLDMHAKNISLLHLPDESMRIAPAYDVVPQVHQNNDGRLAMAVNHQYDHRHITLNDLVAEGALWGVPDAQALVEGALESVLSFARSNSPDDRAYPGLQGDIVRFSTNLIEGRAAADDVRVS